MRRRTFLRSTIVGLGAVASGCSATASSVKRTNDLVFRNDLDVPVDVHARVAGEVELSLVYPLGPNERSAVRDYVGGGQYQLTVTATMESNDGPIEVDDTGKADWDPSECHDKRVVVRNHEIAIESAECETTTNG
jgi:hypothetical protein